MDDDEDGVLDRAELRQLLINSGEEVTKELVESIFEVLDSDSKGHIKFNNFL